jgi:hypothetical protein
LSPDNLIFFSLFPISQEIIPSTIPGIVLGALSLLGFIFFIIWMLVQYCACCAKCCCRGDRDEDPETTTQFIKEQQRNSYNGLPPTAPPDAQQSFGGRSSRAIQPPPPPPTSGCTRFMQILILFLTLATVACSGWGIAASLQSTDTQITNFWNLVDTVEQKADNTTKGLETLDSSLAILETSIKTVDNDSATLDTALAALGNTNPAVSTAINSLSSATPVIEQARSGIQSGIQAIDEYMKTTINSLQADIQPPSETFENTGRYIAIAVAFAITIVAALGSGLLSLKVRHPVWASAFVALLWLFVTFLMLLGVGLLSGVRVVSKDACLYSETFAVTYAKNKVQDPQKKEWILNALNYYFNSSAVVDEAPGAALKAVTDVDITEIYKLVQTPEVSQLTTFLASVDPNVLNAAGVPPTTVVAIQNISSTIPALNSTLTELDYQASRRSVQPLYEETKALIRCDFSSASDDLFIAWTIVGSVGFVLAVLCSIRIVRHTFGKKN